MDLEYCIERLAAMSHYEILGVDASAGSEEIQAAYDRILKECYANLRDPKTHDASIERIKQITLARDALLNTNAREKYDESLRVEAQELIAPPSPFRRFLARAVDQLIFISLFYLAYRYLADYVFFEDWLLALELAAAGIAAFIVLETACMALLGTTPGKWALCVRMTDAGGQKPSRLQLVRRNLLAAAVGYALYIPPFSLVAMALQYRKMKKPENKGRAMWDIACGTAVEYAERKSIRLLAALPFAILALVDLFNAL